MKNYTIWRVQSPLSKEIAYIVQETIPFESRYEQYFQKIVWKCEANSKAYALELYMKGIVQW